MSSGLPGSPTTNWERQTPGAATSEDYASIIAGYANTASAAAIAAALSETNAAADAAAAASSAATAASSATAASTSAGNANTASAAAIVAQGLAEDAQDAAEAAQAAAEAAAAGSINGIPSGGTTKQVLRKTSATNYAVAWADIGFGAAVVSTRDYAGNWGARIALAIADLPANGGIVDARGETGAQVLSADLTISTKRVTILCGPMVLTLGSFKIIVTAGTHAVRFVGCNLFGGQFYPDATATYLQYTGNSDAITVGTSVSATETFLMEDMAVAIGDGGDNARAVVLNNLTLWTMRRVRMTGKATGTQSLLVLDGTGGYTGLGLAEQCRLNSGHYALHMTGSGVNGANANMFSMCSITGAATHYGIRMDAGGGNTFIGCDVEGWGTGLYCAFGHNKFLAMRFESNTADINFTAASSVNYIQYTTDGTGTVTDAGSTNTLHGLATVSFGQALVAPSVSAGGANPASAGNFRAPRNSSIVVGRNQANSGDVVLIGMNSSDELLLRNALRIDASGNFFPASASTGSNGASSLRWDAMYADNFRARANSASAGLYGASNSTSILLARNNANNADLTLIGVSTGDVLQIASGGIATTMGGQLTMSGKITTVAVASGQESLILTPGTAPSAPTNGSLWATTLGVYHRANGVTQGPFTDLATVLSGLTTGTLPKMGSGVLTNSVLTEATGLITIDSSTGAIAVGQTTASAGRVRVPNNGTTQARNNANNANIIMFKVGTDDILYVGTDSDGSSNAAVRMNGRLSWFSDNSHDIGTSASANRPANVYVGSSVSVGSNPASAGGYRIANNTNFNARNNANSANVALFLLTTGDNLSIGSSGCNAVQITNASRTIQLNGSTWTVATDAVVDQGDITHRWRTLFLSGGITYGVVSKSANYTATANDHTILCDTSGAGFTLTLPAAASHPGRVYIIRKISADANTLTIDPNGTETIDGSSTSLSVIVQWTTTRIQSDGTNWQNI